MAKKRNKRSTKLYFQKQRKWGPFRRSIFVHTSHEQDRATRRLNMIIRMVVSLLIVGAVVLLMIFIFGYLIPFLQEELSESTTAQPDGETSIYIEPNPVYDEMGIQIYSNEITLYLINASNPGEQEDKPETTRVGNIEVSTYMAASLELLTEAANEDGLLLNFTVGYVSYEEQEELYEAQVRQLMEQEGYSNVMARTEAKGKTPMAGESDFQTGLCVLLSNDQDSFEDSDTYLWLNRNMADYGFVFRYPKDKESETGMEENLCVLRYVGSENATRMRQLSMCLEEYVDYLSNQQG